jgi:hypothetical protein
MKIKMQIEWRPISEFPRNFDFENYEGVCSFLICDDDGFMDFVTAGGDGKFLSYGAQAEPSHVSNPTWFAEPPITPVLNGNKIKWNGKYLYGDEFIKDLKKWHSAKPNAR